MLEPDDGKTIENKTETMFMDFPWSSELGAAAMGVTVGMVCFAMFVVLPFSLFYNVRCFAMSVVLQFSMFYKLRCLTIFDVSHFRWFTIFDVLSFWLFYLF